MPELAIVGYGKMGKLIEQLAPEYGFRRGAQARRIQQRGLRRSHAGEFRGIDVAIDFSIPAAVPGNVEGIAALGVNLVVGTTGWLEHLEPSSGAVERTASAWCGAPIFRSA
jgi:4-hydroxy-tetrahydrodipicolinate reductase